MYRTLVAVVAFLLAVSATAAADGPKAVSVPKASKPITVDGKLSEADWARAGLMGAFVHYKGEAGLRNQTRVRLLYDDTALYVAFTCAEREMSSLKKTVTAHDGSIWNDDCVEIFLDTAGDRSGWVQLGANALCAKYDALGNDPYGFNPKWDVAVSIRAREWTAEIRVPFSELGASSPKPGDCWTGNFCREEQAVPELSAWCATNGSFASTASFGEIVFGSFGEKASRDLASLTEDAKQAAKSAKEVSADVSRQTDGVASILASLKAKVSTRKAMTEREYAGTRSLVSDARRLLSRAADITRQARMGNPDYLVWETTPWRHFKMREDYSAVTQETTALEVTVLAGQTESRALMVTNLGEETLAARVFAEGLPGVEILFPAFVRSADGAQYPDALIPPDPAGQLVVPAGETRQIWINIKGTDAGACEGTITISPLTASKTDKQVKVRVDAVRPKAEGNRPLVFTWDFLGDAETRGLRKEYVATMVDHGVNVFLISGLRHMPRPRADDSGKLLEPMDWSKFEDEVKLKWRPGRKLYITMDVWEKAAERPIYNGKFATPGWNTAFKTVIAEMVKVLTHLGLSYDDYMVNPLDESIDDRYVTIARLIKEVDPKIITVEDTIGESLDQVKAADKYTDHWIPHFRAYRAESGKASIEYMKSIGKPVGFYFYSEGANEKGQDSYGHYVWDFWYAYSRGLNGIFGYWTATQHYGDPWNRHQTDAHYDPSLFYPGDGCVISGRRWEAWRRGLEDFALLETCEASGVDKSIITQVVQSVLDCPRDPDAARKARETLIGALGRTSDE